MTDLSPETVRAMWRQIDRQAQEIATLHAALQAAANDVTELLDCVPMWMTEGPTTTWVTLECGHQHHITDNVAALLHCQE